MAPASCGNVIGAPPVALVTSLKGARRKHGGARFRTALLRGGKMAAAASVRDVIARRRATMLEALGGGGLLLVRDNAESEGRSLLRALASEAVARSQQVLVILLEVPREQFQLGLSPDVSERLHFWDLSGDPLGWLGRGLPSPTPLGGLLGGLPSPPGALLLLDSLSWALLREPLPHLARGLGALLGGSPKNGPPPQMVALLHQELHPPQVLGVLGGLARAQLILGGPPRSPGDPRGLRLLRDPKNGGGPLEESLSLLPDGSLGPPLPEPPQNSPNSPNLGVAPPVTPLSFRLGLSGAERGARAALTPPYLPRSAPEPPPEEPEDPDEDLEL